MFNPILMSAGESLTTKEGKNILWIRESKWKKPNNQRFWGFEGSYQTVCKVQVFWLLTQIYLSHTEVDPVISYYKQTLLWGLSYKAVSKRQIKGVLQWKYSLNKYPSLKIPNILFLKQIVDSMLLINCRKNI